MDNAVQQIADDLSRLGVRCGDTLLVKADVRYMRLPRAADGTRVKDYAEALLQGLRTAVGEDGTLAFLTFTRVAWKVLPFGAAPEFEANVPPTTGSLATLATRQPDAHRSAHPSNSFTAIGKNAEALVRFHTPSSFAHRPLETLIELDGKMLILGCVETNPGFSTVHLAQHHLGLSTRTLLKNRGVAKYSDPVSGESATFVRRDIAGCSAGFGKMYNVYRAAGLLKEGGVVRAPSLLIDAGDAYELDYATLRDDPEALLCDNPECQFCRGLITYGSHSPARYWWSQAGKRLAGRVPLMGGRQAE